jgi:hypothetical protein
MDPTLVRILDYLDSTQTRATYQAVAGYIHVLPIALGDMLGRRCPKASWVVNARSKMPKGYFPTEIHPDLKRNAHIIRTDHELRRLMG